MLHPNECKGLLHAIHGNIAHNDNFPAGARKKIGYQVDSSHPIYSVPRSADGLPTFGKRKRRGGRKKNYDESQETDEW